MGEPFVSVVITVLDAAPHIARCLDSLLALDYPKDQYEVVIVDARSRDATQDIVRDYAARAGGKPEIRLFEKPGTIAVGRNEGVRHARGEFIAVTDGDMVVSKGWLRELLAGFDMAERVGAVGGPNDSETTDLASLTVACIPVHGPTLDEVPLVGRNRYTKPFVSATDWYTNVTRNSMFRKSALESVGGFAEELTTAEDPELNDRLHQAGWSTAYNPKAGVRHHHRDSLRAFHEQMRWYAWGHGHATRTRAYMRRPKQFLPLAALLVFAAVALAGLVSPVARLVCAAMVLLAVLAVFGYAAKAALAKRDARLLLTMPAYFVAWQWAWAIEYPRGAFGLPERRRRRAAV